MWSVAKSGGAGTHPPGHPGQSWGQPQAYSSRSLCLGGKPGQTVRARAGGVTTGLWRGGGGSPSQGEALGCSPGRGTGWIRGPCVRTFAGCPALPRGVYGAGSVEGAGPAFAELPCWSREKALNMESRGEGGGPEPGQHRRRAVSPCSLQPSSGS